MVLSARPIRMPAAVLLALVLASLATPLPAQVRTINLAEMARDAGLVFVGSVAERRSGLDENGDIVTWTTFRVEQPIGFVPVPMVTVKQLGGTADGVSHYLSHMRYFTVGERVLVMFYPTSSLGFTSPVGLDQAVWTVTNDGRVVGVDADVLNGMGASLTRHGITVRPSQDIELARFGALIGELLEGRTIR